MARDIRIDIHDYPHQLVMAERSVQTSTLSARNKELIFGYRDACLRQGLCGNVRLIRVLGVLKLFGRVLGKDFDTLTRKDLEDLISRLLRQNPPYSAETLGTYKAILKKFMSWVLQPDEFPTKMPPAMVAWITCHVRARDRRALHQHQFLNAEEAGRLIDAARTARNRALASSLWETGTRIAEIGNRQIKDLTPHPHGYLLDVDGKTGPRSLLLVSSASHISAWLAVHPFRDNPDAPLWPVEDATDPTEYMRYPTMRKLLIVLFARAGINKRPNPHGLRHGRATALGRFMTEPMLKAQLGWSLGSRMPARYVHLSAADAHNAILAENGLAPTTPQVNPLMLRTCLRCREHNAATAAYCVRCSLPLDPSAAYKTDQQQETTTALVLQLYQLLVEKGLLDEAATQLHEAGLGKALKALATETPGKQTSGHLAARHS